VTDTDVPTLYPSATQLWQYAQTVNAIAGLAASLRARLARARQDDGRLAYSEAEHAARLHQASQLPPIRLMTNQEQARWQHRIPAELAALPHDEPFTVWTAQLVNHAGHPTGQWGLEAHCWDRGRPTSSVFAVCRDAADALAMTRHLREHGSPDQLHLLHQLATGAVKPSAPVLDPARWEAALRTALPASLADRIIIKDPAHPHHRAWQQLLRLADTEVRRVGADPTKLARLVATVPQWRANVRNPPAVARWALIESRTNPAYPATVAATHHQARRPQPAPSPVPLRLAHVRTPQDALVWARGLDRRDPSHRLEAKAGFGHWGSQTDTILARTFTDLVEHTNTAATRNHQASPTPTAGGTDAAALTELANEVHRLDPAKPTDRQAAHMMLGQVPLDIDRLLAAKFGQDPTFAHRLHTIYPNGLPQDTAARRRLAQAGETAAAAMAVPDDPATPAREDLHGHRTAAGDLAVADRHHALAETAAGQPPTTVRRTEPATPARRRR
jgi:hypothetical protein